MQMDVFECIKMQYIHLYSQIYKFNIAVERHSMEQLIKVKGIKGKQNKKKWRKNIDVSALLQYKAQQHKKSLKNVFPQHLIVEDTTTRQPLDPNRFKNLCPTTAPRKHPKEQQKEQKLYDPWAETSVKTKLHPPPSIPAVVNPPSAHSYNPSPSDMDEVVERVIAAEGPKQKTYKIRVEKTHKRIPRARNINKREDQLKTLQRIKRTKEQQDQKQIRLRKKANLEAKKTKRIRKQNNKSQAQKGRVIDGPKIGKQVYKFKEHIPNSDEIPDKLSHAQSSEHFLRDRYDSVFRRGIFEPRTIKMMRNKRKNIKVIQK